MKYLGLLFICLTLLLAACGGAEPTEPSAPTQITQQPVAAAATDTAVPPTATTNLPTTETQPTETAVPATEPPTPTPQLVPPTEPSIQVVSGQLPEGAFFLGDVNAPLTVIDYSDFL